MLSGLRSDTVANQRDLFGLGLDFQGSVDPTFKAVLCHEGAAFLYALPITAALASLRYLRPHSFWDGWPLLPTGDKRRGRHHGNLPGAALSRALNVANGLWAWRIAAAMPPPVSRKPQKFLNHHSVQGPIAAAPAHLR